MKKAKTMQVKKRGKSELQSPLSKLLIKKPSREPNLSDFEEYLNEYSKILDIKKHTAGRDLFDKFIKDNELLINSIIDEILKASSFERTIEEVWGEKVDRIVVRQMVKIPIKLTIEKQLKREVIYLEHIKDRLMGDPGFDKIDSGLIIYDLKNNKLFIEFGKLKNYMGDLILLLDFISNFLKERNSKWLEKFIELYIDSQDRPVINTLQSKVLCAIRDIKSKGNKLTQGAIATNLKLNRTTLIEKCKKEGFLLNEIVKTYSE